MVDDSGKNNDLHFYSCGHVLKNTKLNIHTHTHAHAHILHTFRIMTSYYWPSQ